MVRSDPVALNPAAQPPLFVYLAGSTGTGKSTQARGVLAALEMVGRPARLLEMRFLALFSLPFLLYARWWGLNWRETQADPRQEYPDFSAFWLLREVFPYFFWLDVWLESFFQISLPRALGQALVCERFVLEAIVDLSVALNNPEFYTTRAGKLFLGLIPPDAQLFILDLDPLTLCDRCPPLMADQKLTLRLWLYRKLAAARGWRVLLAEQSSEVVLAEILHALSLDRAEKPWSEMWLVGPRQLIRSSLALIAHWFSQDISRLQLSELVFKLLFEMGCTLVLFLFSLAFLSPRAALPVALLLAHTLNFLLNSHPRHALFGGCGRRDRAAFLVYVEQFGERARWQPAIRQVLVCGGLARREWTSNSGFEARIIHRGGLRNGLRASWFLFTERSRALLARFPLEAYVVDDAAAWEAANQGNQHFDLLKSEW